MSRCLLVLFLVLFGSGVADPFSGPGRQTLVREGWGSVFFTPLQIQGDYEVSVNKTGDVHTLKTDGGDIVIRESLSDIAVKWPDFEAQVDYEKDSLKILWGDETHTFSRAGNQMVYQGPKGQITCTRDDNNLTLEGRKGTTKIEGGDGTYTITSPVGTTRYEPTLSGFRVSGVRSTRHPYLKRGAVFTRNGVGLYVEMALLAPDNPLFKMLEWNTLVEIRSDSL